MLCPHDGDLSCSYLHVLLVVYVQIWSAFKFKQRSFPIVLLLSSVLFSRSYSEKMLLMYVGIKQPPELTNRYSLSQKHFT